MLKNISWDTKDKIKVSLLLFLLVEGKIFFESLGSGLITLPLVLLAFAAGVAFTAFLLQNITEKGMKFFSAQGVIIALTVILALGVVISYRFVSRETILILLSASIMVICAQKLYLMPIAIALGAVTVFNVLGSIHDFVGLSCVPAAIGVSCVCLSAEIKQSAIWKKILFAVFELALIALAVKAFYNRRFTISVDSLFFQAWDTIASFFAVIILVVLIVYSIINNKNIIEIFGYIAVAAFGMVSMATEVIYVLPSAMAMFMMLAAVTKEGFTADVAADEAIKLISSKIKNKKKTKK